MHNVTLILTQHAEAGLCSSDSLLNIIKEINPDVIFEELSLSNYEACYEFNKLYTLESMAIKKYLLEYTVKHFPVDTYSRPDAYDDLIERMYKLISKSKSENSQGMKDLKAKHRQLVSLYGFKYLNSNHNRVFFDDVKLLKELIIKNVMDENLLNIYEMEKETNRKREIQIIQNIYNFSKENFYNEAMLFIGSGHGKSILKVINEFQQTENITLSWRNFNNEIIT